MAQSAPAMAQTIEAYVGERMDDARMGSFRQALFKVW